MINDEGRFYNPHIQELKKRPLDFFRWKMGYYNAHDSEISLAHLDFSYPLPSFNLDAKKPSVCWINHSTFLLSLREHFFLTDPIWSRRCSPIPFLGPKRRHPPGIKFKEIPKVHYVLISHDHYDHLDKSTVLRLFETQPEILWIVPQGVGNWFLRQGIKRVIEMKWWDEIDLDSSFKITAVPAQHFSGRKIKNFNKTLWLGYVVEDLLSSKRFYFVGDTGYNSIDFKKIGEKWKYMDLSLIPIGAYLPRQFMAPVHVGPEEAVSIHQEVGSRLSIGMHWKTFRLSDEDLCQPPYDLFVSLQKKKIDPSQFLVLDPGQKINW